MKSLPPIERARRYIGKCPAAISGHGGHNATFHVAAALVHGFSLGEAEALILLREWNQRCQPPWSDRELEHKAKSAAGARHAQPRGHLLGSGERTDWRSGNWSVAPARLRQATLDPVAMTERFLDGFRCSAVDLLEGSPIRLEGDWRYDGALLLRALYEPQERINFVTEFVETKDRDGRVKANPKGRGLTVERDALVSRFQLNGSDSSKAGAWLRMNPVDGRGIGDANVTAFRFALLESDIAELLDDGTLHEWKETRPGTNPRKLLSRTPQPPEDLTK